MKTGFNHKHGTEGGAPDALSAALTRMVDLCARHIGHLPLQSVSFYRKQARQNDVQILATQHGHAADKSYLDFFDATIKDRKIPLLGTSMMPIFTGDATAHYGRSAYRADQYCFNLRLPQQDAQSTDNMQMVFRSKADFSSALHAGDLEKLPHIMRDAGVMHVVQKHDMIGDGAKNILPSASREALVLYWDITGYKKMLRACGNTAATRFIHKANAAIWHDFQENYACDLLRQEGDGMFMAYPVTGFSDHEMQGATALFLQSAQTIIQRYDILRKAESVPAMRDSFSKIALIRATAIEQLPVPSRYAPIALESKAFAYGRLLMDLAPRDKNVIMVDPALEEMITKTDQAFLQHHNVMLPKIEFGF